MERKQLSKGHSLPRDHRWRDKSGHRKEATEQGALTYWRPTAEGGTSQDMEGKQRSEGHSQTGDGGGKVRSGYGKKVAK